MKLTAHPEIPDAATVRAGFERLSPDTQARWGTLDAPAMLEHIARFNELYLGRRQPSWMVRTLARLFAGPFLKKLLSVSPFDTQRGMRTLGDLRVEPSTVDGAAFEEARARVISTLDELDAIRGTWDHPLYGSIDAETGKALVRHHAAHHLHQFGVLERVAAGG